MRAQEFFGIRFFVTFMDGAAFEVLVFSFTNFRFYYYSALMQVGSVISVILVLYYCGYIVLMIVQTVKFSRDMHLLRRLIDSLTPSPIRFFPADLLYFEVDLLRSITVLLPNLRLIRAFVVAFLLVYLETKQTGQIIGIIIAESIFLLYLVLVMPRKSKFGNIVEIICQLLILGFLIIRAFTMTVNFSPDNNLTLNILMATLLIGLLVLSWIYVVTSAILSHATWNDQSSKKSKNLSII